MIMNSTPNLQRPPVPSSITIIDQGGGQCNGNAGGATNHWVRTGHHWKMTLGSYNVRTLMDNKRILELETELDNMKWDIIGLCETRKIGESKLILKSGNILLYFVKGLIYLHRQG